MQDYKPLDSQSQGKNEGLCRRLFNYIVNALFPLRSKHLEFDNHHHQKVVIGGTPVVEGSSRNGYGPSESNIRSRGSNLGSEIEIEFRHTEIEQEIWSNGMHEDENGKVKKSKNGEFQGPVAKKTVEIRGSGGKIQSSGKMKQIDGEMKTTHSRPVSRANSNSHHANAIEEFLKTRKEAMRRYLSMDHKEKQ